jgi:hypothetical protein
MRLCSIDDLQHTLLKVAILHRLTAIKILSLQ